METKEEILTSHGCPEIPFDENVTMFYPAILEAMEEYSKGYKEFIQKVKIMRMSQRQFFRTRNFKYLERSKEQEKEIDELIQKLTDTQQSLF
ncbi:MAG: hypothetical protein HQ522_16260 [Bacteroidetes bacterium]|nr:hypothetical protein [Bacteroidota bacterium]